MGAAESVTFVAWMMAAAVFFRRGKKAGLSKDQKPTLVAFLMAGSNLSSA